MFDGVALSFNSSELQTETADVTFAPERDADGNVVQRGRQNPLSLGAEIANIVAAQATVIFGG